MNRGGGGDAALMERRVEEGSGPSNYFINTSKQAATQSPGRLRSRQRGRRLIVMSLVGGIKWNSQNRPHGAKMAAVTYPPECLK